MSFLDDAMAVGAQIVQDANGVAVTYTETGVAGQSANAVINRPPNVRMGAGEVDRVREFTFPAADLTISTWLHAKITLASGDVFLADDRTDSPGFVTFKADESTAGTLTPSGGSSVAVVGIWDTEGHEDEFDASGKRLTRRGSYSINSANVTPAWTPDLLDRIAIGGITYEVERIEQTLPVAILHLVDWEQRRIGGDNTFRARN